MQATLYTFDFGKNPFDGDPRQAHQFVPLRFLLVASWPIVPQMKSEVDGSKYGINHMFGRTLYNGGTVLQLLEALSGRTRLAPNQERESFLRYQCDVPL